MEANFEFRLGNSTLRITMPIIYLGDVLLGRFRCHYPHFYLQQISRFEFENDVNKMLNYMKIKNYDARDLDGYSAALRHIVLEHINRFNRIIFKDLIIYIDEYTELLNALYIVEDSIRVSYKKELKKLISLCKQMNVINLNDPFDRDYYEAFVNQY